MLSEYAPYSGAMGYAYRDIDHAFIITRSQEQFADSAGMKMRRARANRSGDK